MAILSSTDLAQIKADINAIISDMSINVSIKYRQYGGRDYFQPSDQQYGSPYIDWSGVSAIKGVITRDDIQRPGGGVEIGDTKFVFMQSSVLNTLGAKSDLIVESGTTYELKKITLDPLGICYIAYGRSI